MIDWTLELKKVIPSPCYQRPFVCDGFPSQSIAIVIGENPATEMSEDWWFYWDEDKGFNYQLFMERYLEQRRDLGKRISNTRLRLNRIRDNGVACIETNAFANEKPDGAGRGISNFEILRHLITNMPTIRAIIAHGKVAHGFLDKATIPSHIKCYKTRHFRSEKYSVIDSICEEIANA